MTRQIAVDIYTFENGQHFSEIEPPQKVLAIPSELAKEIQDAEYVLNTIVHKDNMHIFNFVKGSGVRNIFDNPDDYYGIQKYSHLSSGVQSFIECIIVDDQDSDLFVKALRDIDGTWCKKFYFQGAHASEYFHISYLEYMDYLDRVWKALDEHRQQQQLENEKRAQEQAAKKKAQEAHLQKFPQIDGACVYVLYDKRTGYVGYVGKTQTPYKRWKSHLAEMQRQQMTLEELLAIDEPITTSKVRWMNFVSLAWDSLDFEVIEVYDTDQYALIRERELIQRLAEEQSLTNSQLYGAIRTSPCPYEPDRLLWRQRLLGY